MYASQTEKEIDIAAITLWDYLTMNQALVRADCILGLGSYDIRVAERCATLFLEGWAPFIIFSGGRGRLTPSEWGSEATEFTKIAVSMGVPSQAIIAEPTSTNTGENIRFSAKMLAERNIDVMTIILVTKPYMERRAYATLMQQWPGKTVIATGPELDYEHYPNDLISREEVINVMIGDFQRIKEYPAKGYQIAMEIPNEVETAYQTLINLGFTNHML